MTFDPVTFILDLDLEFWRCVCMRKMTFLGQEFQKL